MSLRKPSATTEEKARWIKLHLEERWTTEAIAKRYDRAVTVIRRHLRQQGVELRSSSSPDMVRSQDL